MGRGFLGKDQHIAAQDVIHIDPLLRQDIDKRQVAGCLDEIAVKLRTTNEQRVLGAKLGAENALFIGGSELDGNFVKAASNLPFVDVLPQQGINVYDILRRDVLVLSKEAAAQIEERLK